ncbi:penicillin-binding protein 2 [Patescibacteria group bacterium]|nr:penicillin-binding protein 2 [Patescibacteria group bacterium]
MKKTWKKERKGRTGWRFHLVLILFFAAGFLLISRLVFLQIIDNGFYRALARGQQSTNTVQVGERGDIFAQDKEGNRYLLATNQKVPYVFVTPIEVQDKEGTARELASLLSLTEEEVFVELIREDTLHAVLKKDISEEEKRGLEETNMPGVYLGEELLRFYPHGAFASHVLGFVNMEGEGQYGAEAYYDAQLKGREGIASSPRSPAGYLFSFFSAPGARKGSNLLLTLDYNIQAVAEELIGKAVEDLQAQAGSILVVEPSSGKVIAMASYPEFDPNFYEQVSDLALFQNPLLQQLFEPGSVFKAVTMASALDMGKVSPDTTYMDRGELRFGTNTITNYDARVWGERSMGEVLQYSINTGAVFAEQQLGHRNFVEFLKKFGIFSSVGIDLAGEVFSRNLEFQKGYEINYATASFGQGVEMTPLQLVRAYTAFARDGTMIQPHVGDLLLSTGERESTEDRETTRVISQKAASQITGMLVQVTEEGYGKASRVPGYYIAGKTGTAQISWSALDVSRSGYSEETMQSFIGYAPAFDPRFLALVVLRDPQTKTAEYSAIPVFQKLAQYILTYYEVPPSQETP